MSGILTSQLSSMPFWSPLRAQKALSRPRSATVRIGAWRLLLASVLVIPACQHARGPGGVVGEPVAGSVSIAIVNQNALDVTIYVAHDGYQERLGTVTAATRASFALPFSRLGAGREFHLVGDPVGGRQGVRTEVLHGLDGLVITWTLESDLRRSSVTVH
jgi:hypothetical protein